MHTNYNQVYIVREIVLRFFSISMVKSCRTIWVSIRALYKINELNARKETVLSGVWTISNNGQHDTYSVRSYEFHFTYPYILQPEEQSISVLWFIVTRTLTKIVCQLVCSYFILHNSYFCTKRRYTHGIISVLVTSHVTDDCGSRDKRTRDAHAVYL